MFQTLHSDLLEHLHHAAREESQTCEETAIAHDLSLSVLATSTGMGALLHGVRVWLHHLHDESEGKTYTLIRVIKHEITAQRALTA